MPDTLSRKIYRDLFSDDQWDLIYAMAGHALDNDDFTPEDVYSIRNKIHSLFDYNDWNLHFHWRHCDSSRTGRCHLHWHHRGAMLHSLLQFSPKKMTFDRAQLIEDYIQQLIEGMDYKTMECLVYDTLKDNLSDYNDEQLITEVEEYNPELLGE